MSSNTLYRKYRPQTFADLIGQEHIAHTLLSEIQKSQISHAYLFSGPRGVGKTTTARLLAKAINCLKPKNGEPDNQCEACMSITQGRALDILEIDAASYTGVDNIREVIEHSRFTPSNLKYKVFIVDEVHMLSTAAFNALLKTLEEPPAHALFVLATTEIHKVPETIQSRCQKFDFHRIPAEALARRLRMIVKQENFTVDDNVIEEIVRLADGSSRDAESVLGQVFALGEKKITLEQADLVLPRSNQAAVEQLILSILTNDRAAALKNLSAQVENGIDLEAYRNDIIRTLRDGLLYRVVSPNLRPQMQPNLAEALNAFTPLKIVKLLEIFLSIQQYILASPLPQLPLELAVIESTSEKLGTQTPDPLPESKTKPIETQTENAAADLNLIQIWEQMMEEVSRKAPALALSLKMVRPKSLSQDELQIVCPFTLHVEKLNAPKARALLAEAAKSIIGKKAKVILELDLNARLDNVNLKSQNSYPPKPVSQETKSGPRNSADQLWDKIVNAFEG
ncbi:DNA polymerase III subunit gamma/tau [Candidatus Parcubacteria bacterium]|nr:MAG: DNA polymerase III subunit gamma/tau [Candidatus Parcubacteria bacterium]